MTVYFPPEMRGLAGGEKPADQTAGLSALAAAAAAGAVAQEDQRQAAKADKPSEDG